MMIDRFLAAVETREHTEPVFARATVDFIGRNQLQRLVVPVEGLIHSRRSQNSVADTPDARWPAAYAGPISTPDALARRKRRNLLASADDLDFEAVRIGQDDLLAASRLIHLVHGFGKTRGHELVQHRLVDGL